MLLPALVTSVLLSIVPGAQQATYVKDGAQWLRRERGQEYLVHPTVVTVRLARSESVANKLAGLEVARGAEWLRSN